MSSVSGIGGSAQGLYQFLQSLSSTSSASSPTAASSSSSSTDATQTLGQALQGAAGHHRHHGGGGGFMKQIQDAVGSALQSAQSSGSTTDPNQIVEDAIAKVLQNNPSSTPASAQAGGANDPDGDGDGSSAASGGASSASGQTFDQLLQSFGVSAQQFRQDFLSAVKDAQGGQMNPLTALQSFPIGSTLDAIG